MSDKSIPAFPRPASDAHQHGMHQPQEGMTLRDYFAGLAMQNIGDLITKPYNNLQSKAEIAYAMANAMLKAGKEK